MLYGVKIIRTYVVGENQQHFYEELILGIQADSFDEAYGKAEKYTRDYFCNYTNTDNEYVKTIKVEALDCFLAFDPEGDVQEIYSSFFANNSPLSEEEYYQTITSLCNEEELRPLRNKEFN